MNVEETTVRTARIELAGGREVRLVRWFGGDGGHLDVSLSWPEQPMGGRTEDSIRLPAEAVPELVRALEELEGEE